MLVWGQEITYEMYQANNNRVKAANPNYPWGRIERITQGKTPLDDTVKISNVKAMGTVKQLIIATIQGKTAVTNPSELDGWRGWNYKPEFPVIKICKTVGKKKAAVELNLHADNISIPDFLSPYIECHISLQGDPGGSYVSPRDIDKYVHVYLHTLEGEEHIRLRVDDDDCYVVNSDRYNMFVVAYEEIDKQTALKHKLVKAPDGKYYNVWWKKNADTTLVKNGTEFFEKPSPVEAQLCTPARPKFLGEVSDLLKHNGKDGWLFKVSWQEQPLQAINYQGFWVKYGDRDFNFLNVNTPSAQEYNVIDSQGNVKGTLIQYYQYLMQNL